MELNKLQIIGIVSLILITSGIVVISNISQTYYCKSEDNVKECTSLSLTKKTCYYINDLTEIQDLCVNETWRPITEFTEFPVNPQYKFCDEVGGGHIQCCLLYPKLDYPEGVINRCNIK